jgi:hypothetical protein
MSKGGIAALSLFSKIDKMPHFDIRNSVFDIRFFRVSYSIKPASPPPAAELKPEHARSR